MRKSVLTGFFLLLILSPIAGWALGLRTTIHENRRLAAMPEITVKGMLDAGFFKAFAEYVDDRLPYRGLLIRGKNLIDYRLFNTSPSPKVVLGRGDWLFYADTVEDYMKDSCSQSGKMRALARDLQGLERLLAGGGRELYFMLCPNKATIYPEMMSLRRPANACGKSRYDLLLEAFDEYPLEGFVRVDDLLVEAKKGGQIYSTTGTHWNVDGAKVVTEALLRKIAPGRWKELMPRVGPGNDMEDKGLEEIINVSISGHEEVRPRSIELVSDVFIERLDPLGNGNPHLRSWARPVRNVRLLPRTVVYRDSFMMIPLELMKGSFESIEALWTNSIPSKERVEMNELMRSRIVIIAIVERNLGDIEINLR